MQALPILLYHTVDDRRDDRYGTWAVSPALFDRHMRLIAEEGYRPITVADLADLRKAGAPLPDRTVIVTFDDGLRDFLTGAMPALARHGVPATLFVVAGLVGQTSRWLAPLGEGARPMLTESELRDIAAAGVEIGGHTLTHPELDRLPARAAAEEIGRSREILRDMIGRPVRSFAYPHGYNSAVTRRLTREAGYEIACRVRHALSSSMENQFALSRVIVTEDVDEAMLTRILDGAGFPVAPPVDTLAATGWRTARRLLAMLPAKTAALQ
jgi:O-antigen biosynthesis protein